MAYERIAVTDLASLRRELEGGEVPTSGFRVGTKTIGSDYLLTLNDFEVLVDATAGPVTVSLPPSLGAGQYYRVKKIDSTDNVITIQPAGDDLINDSLSVNLTDQWDDGTLIDAALGLWDNVGSSGTENLIPPGGTTGQVLAKASDADFDVQWITP